MQSLMLGLPASGKTTFLAALWYVVTSGEVADALELETLGPHSIYLNGIRDTWLVGDEFDRTSMVVESSTMRLGAGGDDSYEVVIPDLSGEHSREALVSRAWPDELSTLITTTEGLLLFVHAEEVVKAPTIMEAKAVLDDSSQAEVVAGLDWTPDRSPTAVKLIDLLQFSMWSRATESPTKLSLIASAWDLVEESFSSPKVWLAQEMPLLDQFLRNNPEAYSTRLFGVSAQGAPLDDVRKRLVKLDSPSERIRVFVNNAPTSHDVTEPLRWALSI